MNRHILALVLVALCAAPLWAAAPPSAAVTQQVGAVSANERLKAMNTADVLRMKVQNPADYAATGIKGIKAGDDVEVTRQQDGAYFVKHTATGKTGVLKDLPK